MGMEQGLLRLFDGDGWTGFTTEFAGMAHWRRKRKALPFIYDSEIRDVPRHERMAGKERPLQ